MLFDTIRNCILREAWVKIWRGNTVCYCIPSMWCQRGMGRNMAEKLLLVTDMSHVHPYKLYSQRGMGQNMAERLLCFYKKYLCFNKFNFQRGIKPLNGGGNNMCY